jgi:hypothetical protein
MVLANQYLDQLDKEVKTAILGNIGTLVVFRVGTSGGGTLGKELGDNFETQDLIALPNRNFFVRMLVKGQYADPFSAKTIARSAGAGCRRTSSAASASTAEKRPDEAT